MCEKRTPEAPRDVSASGPGAAVPPSLTLGSSEESETSGPFTESIIDASYPFRLGFPAPLPALPVRHSVCDEKNFPVRYDGITREVTSLLNQRGISWGSVVVVSRRASATVSDQRPTILIAAPSSERRLLVKCSLDKVCLEIYDPESLKIPAHFPIEPEHPIVSVWQKLLRDIIIILDPLCWYSLSVVQRGYSNNAQSNPVTIIITSMYPSPLSHTKRTIQLRCERYNLGKIEGRDFVLLSSDLSPGASIGPGSEPRATGSLGGKLIVRRGNEIHELGVTSFHIVASHQSLQGIKETGLTPDHAASLNVGLVSPSNFDANFQRKTIEHTLDSIKECAENLEEQQGTEHLNETQERVHSKLQAQMDAVNIEAQALSNLNRATGTLWAGSGVVPKQVTYVWGTRRSSPYSHKPLLFPDSGKVEENGPCVKGAIVFKHGRTTGLTRGSFNYVDSAVNFSGRKVFAWHVIGTHNVPFCYSGDSGSWLIDEKGNGLAYYSRARSQATPETDTSVRYSS
ncbi:hypothetical protein AJ78_02630 [Emergomyces pasteurianus Ep9510]|uniref:Uncharacterized protein n=1 Tax=Emergomyces pasteurianus Ep9510 TaxID=1447872 RepID=A0A1J9PL53_9EURO|nr:hypothetical protein AJ78_02630 [Emergomyces pasteurianus Ep9510]